MTIRTVVFIDSRVSSVQSSLSGLDAATTLTVVLNPKQNGLIQMSDALAGLSGLEAIHIVSHGNVGALQLGNLWLTNSNLGTYSNSLTILGQSLLPSGDVLLYGCNVGQGTTGQQFVAALAQATGADVAASTNTTGQGGDWALELPVGSVTTHALAATGYTGQLASYNFAGNAAGYRVDTLNGVVTVVDIDTSNGDTSSTTLTGGNHSLVFADRNYSVQVPGGLVGEFRVNTTTVSDQTAPAVTSLNGGGYVVTWQSSLQDGSGWGIYAQRFDANGSAAGGETAVHTTTYHHQELPVTSALHDGGYVIVWQSKLQDVSAQNSYGIYAQRFDSIGARVGVETLVNTTTANSQEAPAVSKLSGGGFVVTWQGNGAGDNLGVYAQRFDSNGAKAGTETRINTTTGNDQTAPSITALSSGGYVATWQSHNQDGDLSGIYAQRFDDNGAKVGVEMLVNTTTVSYQGAPAITAISGGGYVITWQSNLQDGDGYGIYARRFDASGNPLGTETLVNTTTASSQEAPAITALGNGGYLITWQSDDGGGFGIYTRRFDANGNALGTEIRANTTINNSQTAPAVTALSNGEYLVVWQGEGSDDGSGIYAQRIDASGLPVGVEITGTAGNDVIKGGAGRQRLSGEAGNDTLDGGSGPDTLVGGAGDDTYKVDDAADVVMELANEGVDTVESSVNYTLAANTDNLTLTGTTGFSGTGNGLNNRIIGNSGNDLLAGLDGNDVLTGLDGKDTLSGGTGADTLDGGTGADTLTGDMGDDLYRVDNIGDVVTELASEGTDTVESSITHTLTNNTENLTLVGSAHINGTGNSLNNRITGNSGNNSLTGLDGNDTLNGEAGADMLTGGTGDDLYRVDNIGDVVTELAYEGTDTVESIITYTLTDNAENLTLIGTAHLNGTGNDLNNTITGNGGNNSLTGLAGNDTLNSGAGADTLDGGTGADTLDGGTGADTLVGGTGDDIYVVDHIGDVVTESASEGTDNVQSSITYTLTVNVENLTLTGSGAINGTGNSLNNVITGNSTANIIDGGAGADTLLSGTGDDIYVVDNIDDVVTESASEGTDTVQSSLTWTLGPNLENLILTGAAAINGTGNTANNTLTGNSAANRLDGGAGADTLNGDAGADSLDGGSGVDTASYADATTPVSVILYGNQAFGVSSGNDTLTAIENILGSAYSDLIYGDAADNVLDGGAGNDTLDGALGNDTLLGQTGDDLLNGLAGNDSLEGGDGADSLYGWADSDTLVGGVDTDRLFGGAGADRLDGGADADQLEGDDGADTLLGGAGNDTLRGWNDADSLDGGDGDNTLFGGAGADSMQAGSGADQLEGDDGNDTIAGGAGNDTLRGWNDSDSISGDDGDDLLVGWSGNDTMNGGAGNDQLFGDDGADTLVGGTGGDVLQGGLGHDVYTFTTGFGFDGVKDYDYTAGNSDTFQFNGVNLAELSFARVGDTLKVERTASAGADVIYVNDWYMAGSNGAYKIETWIMGDTSVFTAVQIEALVI